LTGTTDSQLKLNAREHGDLVIRTLAMPKDTNANGDMFGGWLVSQMDLGAGVLARKVAEGRVATVAIDAMSFIRPVSVGDTVSCYAALIKTGTTSMTIKVEAWVEASPDEAAEVVTEGIFTFVAIDELSRPRPLAKKCC
jgi:acyl-CoA thioesterase YciA